MGDGGGGGGAGNNSAPNIGVDADDYDSYVLPKEEPELDITDDCVHPVKDEPELELGGGDGDDADVHGYYDRNPPKQEPEPEPPAKADDTVADGERNFAYKCCHGGNILCGCTMFYGVVEFKPKTPLGRKEMAVVPLSWLIKNERRCYWPTTTKRISLSTIIRSCTPPSRNWRHFAVFKVHYKTQDYGSAERELDRIIGEYKILNSQSTSSVISIVRKSVPSSESSASSDADGPLTEMKKQKLDENYTSPDLTGAASGSHIPNLFANSVIKSSSKLEAGPSVDRVEKNPFVSPIQQPSINNTLQSNNQELLAITPSASSTPTMTLYEALGHNILIDGNNSFIDANVTVNDNINVAAKNEAGFQNTVLTALAKLQTTNDQILLTMQEILRYNKKIALEKMIAPDNLPHFPLKTYEEFLNFEHLAKEDPAINQYMVRRLAALGGSGIEGVTRRIMKYLIANQLGLQFNWKGRHNKIAMESTTTMSIVLEAAKLNFPVHEKNDYQVTWTVKEWLKHSGTRLNQAKKQ